MDTYYKLIFYTLLPVYLSYLIFKKMNIYVGNLSWSMTSQDLENLFTPFGTVASAKIVTDKFNNNRSKGFGFVEMANDDEAKAAIAQLHDTEVLGRNIVVNESTPRPEGERSSFKKPYGGGGNRGGGGFNRGGLRRVEGSGLRGRQDGHLSGGQAGYLIRTECSYLAGAQCSDLRG